MITPSSSIVLILAMIAFDHRSAAVHPPIIQPIRMKNAELAKNVIQPISMKTGPSARCPA
jgi:hypothetical protein